MSAVLQCFKDYAIFGGIESHTAWYANITGLAAEKLLRGEEAFSFLLRKGERSHKENEESYYVTFVKADGSVMHQPFVVTIAPEGFYYENGNTGGPYIEATIDDILPLIMHAGDKTISPFAK